MSSTTQPKKKILIKPENAAMISGESLLSSEQTMWLVKIPTFVAEQWVNAADNELVGNMKISMVAGVNGQPPSKKINVKLNVNNKQEEPSSSAPIPDEFTLDDVPSAPKMFAFSGDDDCDQFVMQGQVSKNMLLKPRGTKEYQEFLWNRNVKTTARREAVRAADDRAAFTMQRTDTVVDFIPPAAAMQKRKAKEISQVNKKTGGADVVADMKRLRGAVFDAFSKSERMTLVELQALCSETDGYTTARLKEMLEDYCKYHPKGAHKHLYELKPEFRDNLRPKDGAA